MQDVHIRYILHKLIRWIHFSEDYQLEMMRHLRKVNVDHLSVGWYQSTQLGNFITTQLLESQYSYQTSIEESVVLIYGKFCFISFV